MEKNELEKDPRFYIDSVTLDDIFRRHEGKITKYDLIEVKIGRLRRNIDGLSSPLYLTEPYMFLCDPENESSINTYSDYCNLPGARKDNPIRSVDNFKKFISTFSGDDYDIKKGVIVVDQFYRIQEGLHRSCILYKTKGPDYMIKVLRIFLHTNTGIKSLIQMYWFDFKRFLHII